MRQNKTIQNNAINTQKNQLFFIKLRNCSTGNIEALRTQEAPTGQLFRIKHVPASDVRWHCTCMWEPDKVRI